MTFILPSSHETYNLLIEKGKRRMTILPRSSQHPPMGVNPPTDGNLKAVSAWEALVWAYAVEHVNAASRGGPTRFAGPRASRSCLGRDFAGGGSINGWLEPAEDARLIDEKLRAWFSHDGEGLVRVIAHAEHRTHVAPSIVVPRLRAVRVLDDNGNVVVHRLRPHKDARVTNEACPVEFRGLAHSVADAQEAAYRAFYDLFLAFLDAMPGFPLLRLKIAGRGLTDVRESLTT